MKFALLGCGFISDAYLSTRHLHPDLNCVGLHDRNDERARSLGTAYQIPVFESLGSLLENGDIELVVNLTNPREHDETTRACLLAGKHVYSEKPLAMKPDRAQALAELARDTGMSLGVAPCSSLSPCAQTLWKAVRDGRVGTVRMVYANFDDGMIAPHEAPWTWTNSLGIPWPAQDEFEVGCTYEHAGYFLTWLCAIFGRVESMTAFASTQITDKGIPVDSMAPDFTCGILEFRENVVARVTCGLVAPKDKSLTVIGDEGILVVENLRDDYGTVWLERRELPRGKLKIQSALRRLQGALPGFMPDWMREPVAFSSRVGLQSGGSRPKLPVGGEKRVDFLRGPSELAASIREKRPCRLSGELGAHIVEVIDKLQNPTSGRVELITRIPRVEPVSDR